jgi:dihydroorotase
MKILIQAPQIVDPGSSFHLQKKNILIDNGIISAIGDKNYSADQVIRAEGMLLTPGWFDLGTFIGDPGLEHKEDLDSGAQAAAAGGFTEIAMLPNTEPVIQTKNAVAYVTRGNAQRLVQIHPMASVTLDAKGEELTEMIDLHSAGAVAFTDGLKPIWHTDIFLKCLQYLQKFDGVLIDHPEDYWLNLFGQMHEGLTSTQLGLKGMPRLAEEIVVSKHLELLQYAGGRLHFARLSTPRAFDQVRAAKKKHRVTCDVAVYQALLEDTLVAGFDTNYKVNPPLRERADNDSIVKALKDGTVDVLCSAHLPQDEESKNLEFDRAEFGIITLQTFAAHLTTLSKHVAWEALIPKITSGPRSVLGMPIPHVEEKIAANLTLFDPQEKWVLDEKTNLSRSNNSPWWGQELTGKAKAVFNNGSHWIDQ